MNSSKDSDLDESYDDEGWCDLPSPDRTRRLMARRSVEYGELFTYNEDEGEAAASSTNWLQNRRKNDKSSDYLATFAEMCEKRQLESECHVVVTEDGYRLKVFRVRDPALSKGTHASSESTRPVALLQHGLLCAADNWADNGDESPAFLLARAGFDVWIPNSRGTRHSRSHETLDPDRDEAFWRFSFQEMAYYDLPAVFDYIEEVTGQRKLSYIGHSLGTT